MYTIYIITSRNIKHISISVYPMAAKVFKMPPKQSNWLPRLYKIIAKNIWLALTYFQDGVHKYSGGFPQIFKRLSQIFKRLPQKFKMAVTNIQKSYGRCPNDCHKYPNGCQKYLKQTYNLMLIILSWETYIHLWRSLETIILAALKRNLMLNSLKHNKLFPKLVYKELAMNGIKRDWWNGLLKKSNISL